MVRSPSQSLPLSSRRPVANMSRRKLQNTSEDVHSPRTKSLRGCWATKATKNVGLMPKRITKNMKKWKIYEKSMDSFVRYACSSKWAPLFSRVDLARQGNWITATNSFPECETLASSAFHSNRCATKTTNAMICKLCKYPRTGSDTLSSYDTKLDHREYAIRFVTENNNLVQLHRITQNHHKITQATKLNWHLSRAG